MEIQENHDQASSETESVRSGRVGFSGPLSGPSSGPPSGPLLGNKKGSKKSARFKSEEYVEITLDVRDDSVSVQNIRGGDLETSMLASRLERQRPSLGSQLSFRIRQVSQELKRITSSSSKRFNKDDRSKSSATRALKGLQFMTKNVGNEGWSAIEKRFDQLSVNGALPKSSFGQCIGMKDSKEFASELFDALARRRGITSNSITRAELREFWEQITDQSFDARLQTFFDM